MKKINILGLGPGSLDYILPAVLKKIEESDIIIGGKRHIESLGKYSENKKCYHITADLHGVIDFINQNREKNQISLVLSGDSGFYSMLTFIKKYFNEIELETLPGISSIQYMFAKISDYWHDAYISSVHGKKINYVEKLKEYGKVGLLTDNKNTPQEISKTLTDNGLGETKIYIGENLSYKNEKIYEFKACKLKDYKDKYEMNVVILKGEVKK